MCAWIQSIFDWEQWRALLNTVELLGQLSDRKFPVRITTYITVLEDATASSVRIRLYNRRPAVAVGTPLRYSAVQLCPPAALVTPVQTALFARGSHPNRTAPPLTFLCSYDLSNFLFTLPLSSLFIYILSSASPPQTLSRCWLQYCALLPTACP